MKIILASQSPRRRELLGQMGLEFTTQSPDLQEDVFSGLPAPSLVETLSREKANQVAQYAGPDALIIAADTVVVRENTILGKPQTPAQAEEMLLSLSNRSHMVYTGVTVRQGNTVVTQSESTEVTFRPLSLEEIRQYVQTGEPMDKAGAYGIQGLGALLVSGIQGDYHNVVGLPLHRLGRILKQFGVDCLAQAAQH